MLVYHECCVQRIQVKLKPRSYRVLIGAGLLRHGGREGRRGMPSEQSRVFVVPSPRGRRDWGEILEAGFKKARLDFQVLEMDDGEPAKKLATVERLAEQMAEAGADRKSVVVALGGGVVGDSAGFLAAMFMRGLPVWQIPTTVVAQLDASIGGQTGVKPMAGKNTVAALHQPSAGLVDPAGLG